MFKDLRRHTVENAGKMPLEQFAAMMLVDDGPGFWGTDLDHDPIALPWLWEGFLALGYVTLLTSQWKSGKTTLMSILLARLRTGGELAGLRVRPAAPGQ